MIVAPPLKNVRRKPTWPRRQAYLDAAAPDINSFIAAETRPRPMSIMPRPTSSRRSLDYDRAVALFQAQVMSKQDFDAKRPPTISM